jgi:hypothetical protein
MANIVFPPSSAPGLFPQEAGGRLINAFADKMPIGAASQVIHRRSPGLERRTTASPWWHTRGFLDINGAALWILNDRVVRFDGSFTVTDVGPLSGIAPVTTARNNNTVPDNLVVTEVGCFFLFPASPPTAFQGANIFLPGSPTSVCDYNGYFCWSFGDGSLYASNLNSTAVPALSNAKENGLFGRRVVRYAGRLYYFGDKWTAVYKDAGLTPFPFQREVQIPRGIVGTHAVAGWEYGWANQLCFVGDDFIAYKLDGYTPTPISTDAVSRDIQQAVIDGKRNLIDCFVYMFGKSAFWVVTCPGSWTWEYNVTSGEWNERKSYNKASWRGSKSLRIFDRWLIGDSDFGELYNTSATYFLEGVDPLVWLVESGPIVDFPRGMTIPRASFHITAGVGDYQLVMNPRVEISWSLDGGYAWGQPVLRRLGQPGETRSHPYILQSGLSKGQGVRYRLQVSDPVHVGLMGGVIEPEQRNYSG